MEDIYVCHVPGRGVVIALSQWEIRVLSADEYYSAWQYIPLLSAAMIFSSFCYLCGQYLCS